MLSSVQIMAKLRSKAQSFDEQVKEKRYSQAKYTYDTAKRVALFVEVEPEAMEELFGGNTDQEPEEAKRPLFSPGQAEKCYLECAVKKDMGFENEPYRTIREMSMYEHGCVGQ